MLLAATGGFAAECDDASGGYLRPAVSGSDTVVIFVHGLAGHPWQTWRDPQAPASWPCLLRRDPVFAQANVYLYGYETGMLGEQPGIEQVAAGMARDLRPVLDAHRQVVFIVHSMGGLVTAQALLSMGSEHANSELMRRIRLVLFFGTPGSGSALASTARRVPLRVQLAELAPGASVIDAIVARWGASSRLQQLSRCFAEERAMGNLFARTVASWFLKALGSDEGVIVDPGSAKALCRQQGETLAATDHGSLVKPPHTQHVAYRALSRLATSCLRPASAEGRRVSLAGRPEAAAAAGWRQRFTDALALPLGAEREAALLALLAPGPQGQGTASRFVVPRDPQPDAPAPYRAGLIAVGPFLQWLADQPITSEEQAQLDIGLARDAGAIVFDGVLRERIDALRSSGLLLDDDHLVRVDNPGDPAGQLVLLLSGDTAQGARLKGFLRVDAPPGCVT